MVYDRILSMSKKPLFIAGLGVIIIFMGVVFFFRGGKETKSPFIAMNTSAYQKVFFLTQDGVEVVGNYYRAKDFRVAVLFLHMRPATKESWDALARALQQKNVASLAIDLRGHGESIKKGKELLDYQNFSYEERQKYELDVEAAIEWLQKEKGFPLSQIRLAGASIGANLTLQALARHPEIKQGAVLSPGNYQGEVKPLAKKLHPDQAVFYATSKDDGTNAKEVEELYRATLAKKELKIYENAGHGTTMLENADGLFGVIVKFLAQ